MSNIMSLTGCLSRARRASLVLACAGLALLAGCSFNTASTIAAAGPSEGSLAGMQGLAMGGETPIYGANVILWQTTSSGYPSAGNHTTGTTSIQLATTTTSDGGNFRFSTSYTCASGQFAYITATGGDVTNHSGSPKINNNLVLMAALGPCSSVSSSTFINLNELSTVAAAYALDNFMYVDATTPGSQLVYVSAPANNNATTGACTGTGTSMSCTAAGLSHAFANALNLVNAVGTYSSLPSGYANTTVPGNSNTSVPQAVISSLGDIMQYCTNSAGGTAGDSSPCGNFFTATTPPSGTTGTAAPTDTLTALMNIARAPYYNVSSLFNLISGTPPWVGLTAAPNDWSVAIAYSKAAGSGSTLGYPVWVALDPNDNVFVLTGNAYAVTGAGIEAMTNGGVSIWSNPWASPLTGMTAGGQLAVDITGNKLWQSVNISGSGFGIYQYSAASGGSPSISLTTAADLLSTPGPVALDRFNNLWYARTSSSCSTQCVLEVPSSGGTYPTTALGNYNKDTTSATQVFVDPGGYVWASGITKTTPVDELYMLYNTGTASAPTYGASGATDKVVALTPTTYPTISKDAAGNIWAAGASTIYEFTPTLSGATSTFGSAVLTTTTAAGKPTPGMVDGGGVYWYGGTGYPVLPATTPIAGGIFLQLTPAAPLYNSTAANNTQYIRPCYVPAGGTTCDAALYWANTSPTTQQFYQTGDAHNVAVDSAGAIWVSAGVSATISAVGPPVVTAPTAGFVVEILGAAYPTWPLISYGVYGTKPQ